MLTLLELLILYETTGPVIVPPIKGSVLTLKAEILVLAPVNP